MLTKNLIEFPEGTKYTVETYGDAYAKHSEVEAVLAEMKTAGEVVSRTVEQQTPTSFLVTTEYRDLDAYVAYMSHPVVQEMVEWIAANTVVSSLS